MFWNKAVITSRVFCFLFLVFFFFLQRIMRSYALFLFLKWFYYSQQPWHLTLMRRQIKATGDLRPSVLLLSSLGLCGQVHAYPHQLEADGYQDLTMGNGEWRLLLVKIDTILRRKTNDWNHQYMISFLIIHPIFSSLSETSLHTSRISISKIISSKCKNKKILT